MASPTIERICPFFVVGEIERAVAFYQDGLGFQIFHKRPEQDPSFAIVGRDGVMIFLKSSDVDALPNSVRDADMRWDAYLYAPDPDGLAAEFAENGVEFKMPIRDTDDGLRGFEISDPDGYVLFFGCPNKSR